MFCANCGKRLMEVQRACLYCGTKCAASTGTDCAAHVIGITRARLAAAIAATAIISLLAGLLIALGMTGRIGAGSSTSIMGSASAQTPPSIDGTWVSQGELDRPFTLDNGVIATSDVEDAPKKGSYTISDEPDGNGYLHVGRASIG